MKRSLYLRRGFLGLAFAGALSVIIGQWNDAPWYKTCPATGEDYPYVICAYGCDIGRGYCNARGFCVCGDLP